MREALRGVPETPARRRPMASSDEGQRRHRLARGRRPGRDLRDFRRTCCPPTRDTSATAARCRATVDTVFTRRAATRKRFDLLSDEEADPRAENLRRALAQEAARIMSEQGSTISSGQAQGGRALRRDRQLGAAEEHRDRGGAGGASAPVRRHAPRRDARRAAQRRALQRCSCCGLRAAPGRVRCSAGTATEHIDINLHLFAERAEAVTLQLMDLGIRTRSGRAPRALRARPVVAYPGVHFVVRAITPSTRRCSRSTASARRR